jgi:hypothetical protein
MVTSDDVTVVVRRCLNIFGGAGAGCQSVEADDAAPAT